MTKRRRKKKLQLKNKTKQVLVAILGVALLTLGALAATGVLRLPETAAAAPTPTPTQMQTQATTEQQVAMATQEPIVATIVPATIEPTATAPEPTVAPTPTASPAPVKEQDYQSKPTEAAAELDLPTPQPEEVATIDEEAVAVSNIWMELQIAKYQDQIDAGDLASFRSIVAKLDQGYIQTLATEGFAKDEVAQLKEHLLARLSPAEYEESKYLFNTYKFVLEEG